MIAYLKYKYNFSSDFLQMVTFYSWWLFTVGDFLQMVTFYRCDFLPTPPGPVQYTVSQRVSFFMLLSLVMIWHGHLV
jgi:hypothetical protein